MKQAPKVKAKSAVKKEEPKPKGMLASLSSLFGGSKAKKEANSSSDEEMDEEVYMHRNLSAASCDSDDLDGDMNLSDEEGAV